jgi:hypothetical protein
MSERDLSQTKNSGSEQSDYQQGGTIYYSLEVTTSKTRLGRTAVERCVSFGIIHPVERLETVAEEGPFYSEEDLLRLRRVRRLISELGLNWAGVEVVMRLTDQLEMMQNEITRLRRLMEEI